ncbi:hypothetical protein GH714_036461 [Hevea brasiliensis]|uniref:Retrotransposon gag domain-containing protein n=1 Tax=Hevea brasiliensis TaxID=3981 RepID=A0A6A6M3A0_HEVBR|nr:hypothetical protein GH714_036461 [Hevea brasiliensis]
MAEGTRGQELRRVLVAMIREMEDPIEQKQTELRKETETSINRAINELKTLMASISLQYNELISTKTLVGTSQVDLKNLKQTGTLEEYLNTFDVLYPKAGIREDQVLSFFLSRLQEITVAALHNKSKPVSKTSLASLPARSYFNPISIGSKAIVPKHQARILPLHNVLKLPAANPRLPGNLTSKQITEKREKGLCFWCDEKFSPGYKCKKRQSFVMQVIVDDGEDENDMVEEELRQEL